MEFCVNCDKRLSKKESDALTADERKYHYILCTRCLKQHRNETQAIIDEPETAIYNRAYVDRLFRDGMNDY